MSLLGKIFVVVVAILSLVFLGVQSALFYHSKDWRLAYSQMEQKNKEDNAKSAKQIEELNGKVTVLNSTVERRESELTAVKLTAKAADDRYLATTSEKDKLRSDHDQVIPQNKTLGDAISGKDKDLGDQRARNDQLAGDLAKAMAEKETAEAQVARLIGQKAAVEKDLAEVRKEYSDTKQKLLDSQLVMEELERQGVPVATLVVNHKPVPPINGKVAGVKADVSPALVLVTVGKDDKVEKGFQFTVYRGSQFVGKVIVEKVNADSSGCRVMFTAPGQVIKAGDDVATRLD